MTKKDKKQNNFMDENTTNIVVNRKNSGSNLEDEKPTRKEKSKKRDESREKPP